MMPLSRLTIIGDAPLNVSPAGRRHTQKLCRCLCGNELVVSSRNLKSGHAKSCGCLQREIVSKIRHGLSNTGTRRSYSAMKQRCYNPKQKSYLHYGAKGITVCDRWLQSFDNFLEDMGERPEGHSIDRHPNEDGNYEPNNCRWISRSENSAKAGRRGRKNG